MHDNVEAWKLWLAVRTQWRVGFAGPVGLDYNALYLVATTLDVTITPKLLEKIQALEDASLENFRSNEV